MLQGLRNWPGDTSRSASFRVKSVSCLIDFSLATRGGSCTGPVQPEVTVGAAARDQGTAPLTPLDFQVPRYLG